MKKAALLMSLCLAVLILTACVHNPTEDRYDELNIRARKDDLVLTYDTHDGFLGDGVSCKVYQLDPQTATERIRDIRGWNPFPMTGNLEKIIYGDADESHGIQTFFTDDNGTPFVPPIQNGFYRFYDRHAQAQDPSDDSQVFERGSYNFTVGIYDADTGKLYILKFDT